METEEIPAYWKDYTKNAIRGVIAAVVCASIFVIIGLVVKYRYRASNQQDLTISSSNGERPSQLRAYYENENVKITGVDNKGMDHEEN